MNGTTTFEWVGGPNDGLVVVLPGVHDRVVLQPPPEPTTYTGSSITDVLEQWQERPEQIVVPLERRRSDHRLVARWPYGLVK